MLAASRLTRSFGARVAVEDVSFDLVQGEIFGLLGPNGGGKTTTLRMLAGLIAPSSGTVVLDGVPVPPDSSGLRRRIGFLTEVPGLWEQFTVRENLLVHARLHGLDAPERAVERTLDLFGVADRAGDRAGTLSKGLKQRVALARTLLHAPEIVLLDEPTAGLDPESARGVRELILSLRGNRRAVVISTHNLDEVERVADRVAVLRRRLLALDTPTALRRRLFGSRLRIVLTGPAAGFVSLAGGEAAIAEGHALLVNQARMTVVVPDLIRQLVEAGAGILSVSPETPPLEDVYLALVRRPEDHS